ncbi:hypothetical protein [Streptomyces sp. CL12-4]|uniref:hypothetical protein n=1 Tax=Streptomyces sp. CL12-4 TaxID=2810306 RepID=UPI001EFB39C0|nr:hypothetical protein [Streptomyces sp. CL12-4]MCG8971487.1 hypothetical protein [Streptomyces sp. CL12-4]
MISTSLSSSFLSGYSRRPSQQRPSVDLVLVLVALVSKEGAEECAEVVDDFPGLVRRVRHRLPPYVFGLTYASEHRSTTPTGIMTRSLYPHPRPVRETPVMSTARRRLGTGPSTTRSTLTTDPSPRLLPVERAESGALLGEAEHQDVAARKGRRDLGMGVVGTPEETQ